MLIEDIGQLQKDEFVNELNLYPPWRHHMMSTDQSVCLILTRQGGIM